MAYDPRRAYDKATGKESLGRRIKRQRREAAAAEAAAANTTTNTTVGSSTNTQGQNQTATTQQQQQSELNLDEVITGSELTREEALEWLKSKPAFEKGTLASLESARARGDAKLIAVYEKQLEADIRMTQERNLKITNNVLGTTSVAGASPVSDGTKFVYDKQAVVERAKSSQGANTYLVYETNRILGGSDTSQTPEQRAALLQLVTRAKHFGGRGVSSGILTDIVEKAMPEIGRSEADSIVDSIRPAVGFSNGKVYTSYGKDIDIVLEKYTNRDDYQFRLVSPEGVKLSQTFLDPKDIIEFGLDVNKVKSVMDQYKQIKPDGVLPGNAHILHEALNNNYSGSDFLRRLQEQSMIPGGGTISTDGGPAQQVAPQEKTGRYKGFGFYEGQEDQFLKSTYRGIDNAITGALLYGVITDIQDYRPSYTPESYLQTLNQAFGTPNNNITFGQDGLQYNFTGGGSIKWGTQLDNLDSFSASIGVQKLSMGQGAAFKAANNFNTKDEYNEWRKTQELRSGYFESLPKASIDTQMEQVMSPTTTPAETDTGVDTDTTTTTDTTTGGGTTYVGAPTDEGGTPVATDPTGTGTGTGIGTGTIIGGGTTYGQQPITGTFGTTLQTSGLSAVPTFNYNQPVQQQAGFTQQQLTSTMPGMGGSSIGVQTVQYSNQFGQTIPVTENNGQPITYVPPGYSKTKGAAQGGIMHNGYAAGGMSGDTMLEAKYRIATMNGYRGPKTNPSLDAFANASEGMKRKFNAIGTIMANKGGYIKGFFPGGDVGTATTSLEDFSGMQQNLITQTMQPQQSAVDLIQPTEEDFIPTGAGQAGETSPYAEAATVGTVQQAGMPTTTDASTITPTTIEGAVQGVTSGMQPVTGTVSDQAQVTAEQQTTSAVSDLKAQQGTAIMMDNPVQREIQDGELISGAANAQKAAEFAEQIEAATAEPSAKATVQGQLEGLMAQFEGGKTPPWAAGSMRAAMATMSARGLGASSMAGQAIIQAAMEAALPIAQADAGIQAQFESQNLSNRQQRAILAAQQRAAFIGQEFDQAFEARVKNSARIGDIANMNFTAEQNIALENSRAANTMELANLSNAQAMVMAEAAALANLDMANLNNRQQAAVQNAQNFLQMDMTNLGFEQQTAMFKAQQQIQALFTDQAAENAAAQFNASSENQTNQFFAGLTSQVSQFNASQQNAMDQFNVNSINALREFNSNLQQQRDLFNAQNGLVIAQANAQWRQNIATLNTAAQNESNMDFAKTINALTSTNLDQIWQRERDIMSFAFSAQQAALDRSLNLLLGDKKIEQVEKELSERKDIAATDLAFRFFFGSDPSGLFGGIFNNKKGT